MRTVLAFKSSNANRVEHPEKLLGKMFPKMAWTLGGVDLAWIFGTEKRAPKSTGNPRRFLEQNPRRFLRKIVPKSVPQYQEPTPSSNPRSLCACSFQCSELSDCKTHGKCPQAIGKGPTGRMHKIFGAKKNQWTSFCASLVAMNLWDLAEQNRESRIERSPESQRRRDDNKNKFLRF